MGYYDEVYLKRLNRYGNDYQARIQGQREREFDNYLKKTVYLVDFDYDGNNHLGSLEPNSQDLTKTQAYLLTKIDVKIPNGTILDINEDKWLIWWLEDMAASGYNRYIVLKISHNLKWTDGTNDYSQYGHFSGPGMSKMNDIVKSKTNTTVYRENNNLYMFIMPKNEHLKVGQYFTVDEDVEEGFVIIEMDNQSTKGITYVSVDPVPLRKANAEDVTLTAADDKSIQSEESSTGSFWLGGGV